MQKVKKGWALASAFHINEVEIRLFHDHEYLAGPAPKDLRIV